MDKILYITWGYNMRINSFYKVISETDKTATVVRIGNTVVDNNGFLFGYEIPNAGEILNNGKEYRVSKKNGKYRGSVDLSIVHNLYEVEIGKLYSFNHCD